MSVDKLSAEEFWREWQTARGWVSHGATQDAIAFATAYASRWRERAERAEADYRDEIAERNRELADLQAEVERLRKELAERRIIVSSSVPVTEFEITVRGKVDCVTDTKGTTFTLGPGGQQEFDRLIIR